MNRKTRDPVSRAERMAGIMKKLEDGVKDLFTSEKYQTYLATMAKFHKYSFNNTILIALQKPDATLVAGYTAWKTKFHRQVRKGEKGIQIIAPVPVKEKSAKAVHEADLQAADAGSAGAADAGVPEKEKIHQYFKAATVFDISQTEGEPLPTIGVEELSGQTENYSAMIDSLRALSPVPVRFDEITSGAKGYFSQTEKEVVVKRDMSQLQTVKTLIHEIAHAVLHDREKLKAENLMKDRLTKEVEAESVAFSVCTYFGLDTSEYSFPYIAGWSSSMEMNELKASMDTIRKTAGSIIEQMEKDLQREPERSSVLKKLEVGKAMVASGAAVIAEPKKSLLRNEVAL